MIMGEATTDAGQRRLQVEEEIWLTTVRPDGQPQTSPVGFLWDGDRFLVVTQPDSAKVRNLRANPRVSLHLDIDRSDGDGGGVLTAEGDAVVEPGPLTGAEAARYVAKYRATMDLVGVTADEFLAGYSAVVRITPTRIRAY
jgi:PPOX class probable F420-dependent enzyme